MKQCRGAYACVAMIAGFGIIAFRDPNGIRPVGMASRKANAGKDWLFASESIVADAGGFSEWQDVKPGKSKGIFLSHRCRMTNFFVLWQVKLLSLPVQGFRDVLSVNRQLLHPISLSMFISPGLIPYWTA
jgi:hypothetical protein